VRSTYHVLNILATVLGLQEIDDLSTLRRDGGGGDLRGRAFADAVECQSELVVRGFVDLLADLGVVVVDGEICSERLDEL
jgi:hypothetical protein